MAQLLESLMAFIHLVKIGGGFIIPLIICSLVTLTIVVEQWWYSFLSARRLKRLHRYPKEFSDIHGLDMISRMSKSLVRNAQASETVQKQEMELVYNHFERRINWLNTMAALAPLLGLLGTVSGMIRIFAEVSSGKPENPLAQLSAGISEALFATGGGLIVAIIAALAYHWLNARLEAQGEEMALWYYENRSTLSA